MPPATEPANKGDNAKLVTDLAEMVISPALDGITFESVAHARDMLKTLATELQLIRADSTPIDPENRITALAELKELFVNAERYINKGAEAERPPYCAQLRQTIITEVETFIAKYSGGSDAALAAHIAEQAAARLKAAAESAKLITATMSLYDKDLTAEERAQMQAFNIHVATKAPEARLCITMAQLHKEISELMAAIDAGNTTLADKATEVAAFNARYNVIFLDRLQFRIPKLPDPTTSIEQMHIRLENLRILFEGRRIAIDEYNKLPELVKIFLFQEPKTAMPYYGMIEPEEFSVCVHALYAIGQIRRIAKIDVADPSYADEKQWLIGLINEIYLRLLWLVINLEQGAITDPELLNTLEIRMLNIRNIFKTGAVTLNAFKWYNPKIKKIMCENPDVVMELINKHNLPAKFLMESYATLLLILDNLEKIKTYCADKEITLQDFLSQDEQAIATIIARTDNPLFAAIKRKVYSEVVRLVGLGANVLGYNHDQMSYYALVLHTGDDNITAVILRAIRSATEAKLQIFLEANGFDATDLNKSNADGETPLTVALEQAEQEMVLALLTRKVDVLQVDSLDQSPIDLAVNCADERISNDVLATADVMADERVLASVRMQLMIA